MTPPVFRFNVPRNKFGSWYIDVSGDMSISVAGGAVLQGMFLPAGLTKCKKQNFSLHPPCADWSCMQRILVAFVWFT